MHESGDPCAAQGPLARLNAVDLLVMREALSLPDWRRLARLAELPRRGVPFVQALEAALRDEGRLAPRVAHEIARLLVQPLIPTFTDALAAPEGDPLDTIRRAVGALAGEWPPGIVRLGLELAWEVGELPSGMLDREALERFLDRHGGGTER